MSIVTFHRLRAHCYNGDVCFLWEKLKLWPPAELADLNHGDLNHDFNRDLNQMLFLSKKSCDLNHSCLYTLNPLCAKNLTQAQAQHMYCLKLFLYSFIQSLSSKTAHCYFCQIRFEHITTLNLLCKLAKSYSISLWVQSSWKQSHIAFLQRAYIVHFEI